MAAALSPGVLPRAGDLFVPLSLRPLWNREFESDGPAGHVSTPRPAGNKIGGTMTAEEPGHNIRIAGIHDAALLSQLGGRTFREAFGRFIPPMDLDSYVGATYNPARQMDELTDPFRKFLIAEQEGVVVGYAMLHARGAPPAVAGENPIGLERLYLLQDSIGCGLGSALMRECMEESRRCGHKAMWLQVWERNERAIACYRKWGFDCIGTTTKKLGASIGKDWIMVRKI